MLLQTKILDYYLVINKRNFPRNLQNATFRIFNQNLEKISNKIKINSKLRNKPISQLQSSPNFSKYQIDAQVAPIS